MLHRRGGDEGLVAAQIEPFHLGLHGGGEIRVGHRFEGAGGELGNGRHGKELAAEARHGLQPVLAVDQEGVAQRPGPRLFDDMVDIFQVDGHPENPRGVLLPHHHRDDEVGKLAVPHEDVTDMHALGPDLVEPGLVLVVHGNEQVVVGADIGEVVALAVDDADVHVGIGFGVHDFEHPTEVCLVGQFREGVGVGDREQLGDALVEEQVDGVAAVLHRTAQGLGDLVGVDAVKQRVQAEIDEQQRDDGKADDGQAVAPPEHSVVSIHDASSRRRDHSGGE